MASRKIVRDLVLSRQQLPRSLLLRFPSQQVVGRRVGLLSDARLPCSRQFSIFNEFAKQVKGEAKSNPELQQSVKELNEKVGRMKEDFKVRTKQTTDKIYKHVGGIWTEAESTTKKASVNVKETLSAAKEEVRETLGIGKQESSESSSASTNSSSGVKSGDDAASGTENFQSSESSRFSGSDGQPETVFSRFKSATSSVYPKVSVAIQKLKEAKIVDLAKKGYTIIKDELNTNPSKRRKMQYASTSTTNEGRSTRTDIVVLPSKQSRLGRKWEALKAKMRGHPAFKRVSGISEPVVTKGQELAEDMRERWETSDHPVVHKIQDLNETVFGETSTALSFKEIRRRDPSFSLPEFVAEVQEMIRPTLTAYLKGDVESLKKYCSPEVIERCKGERQAYESQGFFFDNKILHISEIEVRETKMMGSSPIIILAFQTQQIYCVRDREGSVTDGGKDTIQTVYYHWAMQLLDAEDLGEGALYPMWKLREMQQIGVQALI